VTRVRHRSSSLTAGTLYPAVAAIPILNLWHCTIPFSAAELGSVGEFRGSHLVPNDGTDAVYMCGLLFVRCDDEAAQF